MSKDGRWVNTCWTCCNHTCREQASAPCGIHLLGMFLVTTETTLPHCGWMSFSLHTNETVPPLKIISDHRHLKWHCCVLNYGNLGQGIVQLFIPWLLFLYLSFYYYVGLSTHNYEPLTVSNRNHRFRCTVLSILLHSITFEYLVICTVFDRSEDMCRVCVCVCVCVCLR